MEKLKVKNAIISKQGKESSNYKKFKAIAKQRNIKVITVKAGDRITIDKQCYIDILFPEDNLISENVLNNNSIVAKFHYQFSNVYFSLLLTGDVEKIAENKLVELYENTDKLTANILKVAHHGSKTSSTEEFLEAVKPKIALIGVGEKNTFGHPNQGTLEKLNKMRL